MGPRRTMAVFANHALARDSLTKQRLANAMHDQVRIAPDRRSEMRVARRSQRKMALVDLRVARLLERAQHQVTQDPLLRLACNPRRELLIHPRRHRHVFRHLIRPRIALIAPSTLLLAAISARLKLLHWQRAQSKRIPER